MTKNSDLPAPKTNRRKKLLNVLQYFVFFVGGIGIFIWVYRGQSPGEILDGLTRFDYGWIALSFVLALLSHFFRAVRWRMLIQPMGYNPRIINTYLAILIMYLANFALPRLGEVTRCGILKRYEKVPFTGQLGTVVVERAVDFVVLLLLILWVFLAEWGRISGFVMGQELDHSSWMIRIFSSGLVFWLAGGGALMLLLIYLFRKSIFRIKGMQKLVELIRQFTAGLKSIRNLKSPLLFIILTLAIYAAYWGMTYSVFKGFMPTSDLGPMAGLTLLTLGSVGMVLPVQGGIGTYHFFAVETLVLYGIVRTDGQLFALVLHGSMSLFLILIGVLALLVLPLVNRRGAVVS